MVSTPAAGVEISVTVPAGVKWRIQDVAFLFTTDATAVDRTPTVRITATSLFLITKATILHGASSARVYIYNWTSINEAAIDVAGITFTNLTDVWVPEGSVIATNTVNLQAGDAFTAPTLIVEELPM